MTDSRRLVLLSFLMLFVELALIRWMGANIVYLSYFSNFVLLGSFLGIGIGFLRSKAKVNLFQYAPLALFALVFFVITNTVEINRSQRDLIFFGGEPTGPPIWVMLPLIFLSVALVMAMIGEGVARTFVRFEPLEAYRLDILGSIAGIVAFSVLSFFRAPPLAWGIIAAIALLATVDKPFNVLRVGPALLLVLVLGLTSFGTGLSWSPYYKINTKAEPGPPPSLGINVNGIPHQAAATIASRVSELGLYDQPYEVANPHPKDVLIVGAGSGNDVSRALAAGAQHIDAVEIDPRIREIGKESHPDHPYDNPRVDVHIDDGRAFLERSNKTYDLIILALPDSLTLVSGQSSLRLESYLFTKEAFESFKSHLNPDGAFAMYNSYREVWLRDRYANTLAEVYGRPPCLEFESPGANAIAALTVGNSAQAVHCQDTWQAEGEIVAPATDDYPFPYLHDASIPSFYLMTMAMILIASVVLIGAAAGPSSFGKMKGYLDLFFMGVAFLLLETKSVVQFALLFGTTWFVNALVFMGVLLSVYLAVELSRRIKLPSRDLLYGGLLASLLISWLVPISSLLSLDPILRFVLAITVTFAPIFFANLIFAQRFRDVGESTAAFGANLLGAMVGGLIEYVALITGYRSLLILVAVFYGLAFVIGRATWMRRAGDIDAATSDASEGKVAVAASD